MNLVYVDLEVGGTGRRQGAQLPYAKVGGVGGDGYGSYRYLDLLLQTVTGKIGVFVSNFSNDKRHSYVLKPYAWAIDRCSPPGW